MEMEQVNKVVRLNENPMGNEEEVKVDDGDDENEILDKLPPEILTKILDYLDEQELVKCRLMSSRWNEISCVLLQDKTKTNPDSKLTVKLKEIMECQIIVTKPLQDFLNCFGPSEAEKSSGSDRRRPFPFSRFHISELNRMQITELCEFVSTFGPQMKIVFVDIIVEDIANFEKFWKLLLHFAPNIEHLRIICGDCHCLSYVNLVDPIPITKFRAEKDQRNFKAPNNNKTFENLKVLEIESHFFGLFNNFMKNLLDSIPNVKQVSCLDPETFWRKHQLVFLEVWQKLKKAHLVKKLDIRYNSCSRYPPPAELMKNLGLEDLTADCTTNENYVEKERSLTNYISHALKSSQSTLSKLHLYNLTMESVNLCFKDIKSLPTVRQLRIAINDSRDNEGILEKFSQLCPHITSLKLDYVFGDFSKVARILWTRFTGLKTLEIELDIKNKNDDSLALDSAISGYSQESIQKIQSKLELDDGISLEEARRSEPQNLSILDLKDLRRLELVFLMGKRTSEMKEVENQLRNSVFVQILPQHIRENPRSISYQYFE